MIIALGESETLLNHLLEQAGVEKIDPDSWYDYDWSMHLIATIEEKIGRPALIEVGRKVVEAAALPPGIDNLKAMLMSLGPWFEIHARGPDIGTVVCEFDGDNSAVLDWSAKGPCAYCIGILEGACQRFGATPLVEHSPEGCKDKGDDTCIYYVSW